MKTIMLISLIMSVTASLAFLVKFLQYYVSELIFVRHCRTANGRIVRWAPASASSTSARSSWWSGSSTWCPIISYYDPSLGTTQEHEAILPRGCKLSQQFSPESIEIQYYGRHVRISDEKYVNPNIYNGLTFFIFFTICALICLMLTIVYFLI